MRIVFVIDRISSVGGFERILTDKMNYLTEYTSAEVILVTVWKDRGHSAYSISDKVRCVDLSVPLSYIGFPIAMPWALHRFNKEMKRLNPDVIVLSRALGAFFVAFSSWRGKMVYESHVPLKYLNHKWVYPLMLKRIHSVVCLTSGDAEDVMQMCSRLRCNPYIKVIPNFSCIGSNQLPDYNSPVIVAAGRRCPEKNFERLEKLWCGVKKNNTSWQLKIHHDTKDMISAYLEGSIFVMTSRFEGFGLVLIEAMSCGLPCIAFDCPYGPRDIIEDGKTGYLIPYDNDDIFIEKLTCLMEHPEERERMGKAAKEAVKRFSRDRIMNEWEKFYFQL